MGTWESYTARLERFGRTEREKSLNQEKSYITRKMLNSISCHDVKINGHPQKVTILNERESMALKKICAFPDENLEHGGIVDFANSKWLITEIDANKELYESGKMQRCNYILKWLDEEGKIIEKWCIIEDGTKYLVGEKTEDIMSIGDARIAVTIGKDADTSKLKRGKRFLIDDLDSEQVLAYQITKPNRLYNIFDGKGVYRFIMNEVNLTDDDNVADRIADFYNWSRKVKYDNAHEDKGLSIDEVIENSPEINTSDDKEVWI